ATHAHRAVAAIHAAAVVPAAAVAAAHGFARSGRRRESGHRDREDGQLFHRVHGTFSLYEERGSLLHRIGRVPKANGLWRPSQPHRLPVLMLSVSRTRKLTDRLALVVAQR